MFILALIVCNILLVDEVVGKEVGAEGAQPSSEQEERIVFELGRFHIRDLRPSRNETAELNFVIHLALKPGAPASVKEDLEMWRHRLRDQLIVSTRVTETKDFSEPGLERMRRLMLLRTNRLLGGGLVDELLLTEFVFTLK